MSQQSTKKQSLEKVRTFFGSLIVVTSIVTLIALGYSMDDANFPGANMAFETTDGTPEGELLGNGESGWAVSLPDTCSNIYIRPATVEGVTPVDKPPCYTNADGEVVPLQTEKDATDKPKNGPIRGWVVSNSCVKVADTDICAPFAGASVLGVAGSMTFSLLALQAILYGVHTALALNDDPRTNDDNFSSETTVYETLGKKSHLKFKTLFILNIVWTMLSCFLFVWSAVAWQGMCDKLDTGLGRVVDRTPFSKEISNLNACATNYCTIPFSGFMWSYAVSLMFYTIPRILILSGFTSDASYKEVPSSV